MSYRAASIFLTERCFFNCSHCNTIKLGIPLFSIQRLNRLSTALLKSSTVEIYWGGGEPLATGKNYMKAIVELPFFESPEVKNILGSTLHISIDKEWLEILRKFDMVLVSADSFRIKNKNFSYKTLLNNLTMLGMPAEVSYTPSEADTPDTVEYFWRMFSHYPQIKRIRMGFLYADRLIHPDKYLELLQRADRCSEKYKLPLGFTSTSSENPFSCGWRAYDCFTKGIFISGNIVTSCFVLQKKLFSSTITVPSCSLDEFLSNPDDIYKANRKFTAEFFFGKVPTECRRCDYYVLCLRGCPFFSKEYTEKDPYCKVYRYIFQRHMEVLCKSKTL